MSVGDAHRVMIWYENIMSKKKYRVLMPVRGLRISDSASITLRPGTEVFVHEPFTDPIQVEIDLELFEADKEVFLACATRT
jgi:hypothetical protein